MIEMPFHWSKIWQVPTLDGRKVPTAQNIEVPRLAKHDKEEKYSVLAKSAQIIEVPITRGFTVPVSRSGTVMH